MDLEPTISIDAETAARLAERLHAMAQPLTILRGATGALQLSADLSASERRYIEMCSTQADRLCAMLSDLRDLLDRAQSPEAEHCAQPDANITSEYLRAPV